MLGRAGRWAEAVELLRLMRTRLGVRPTAYHATSALKCCDAAGQWALGLELLAELAADDAAARRAGGALTPDAPMFDVALVMCSRVGDWRRALELVRALTDAGHALTPRMRTLAIVAAGRAARPQRPGLARAVAGWPSRRRDDFANPIRR